jgi:RNA polymerase sigma factor (sigma-70 family)
MDKEALKIKIADFIKTERIKLLRYVQSLIADATDRDGEDIVQDVMVNIFNAADVSIPINNLAAYIYQSLRNRIIDILKKSKYESVSIDETNPGNYSSLKNILQDKRNNIALEVEKKEMTDNLYSAIDSLDPEYREIIYLTEFEGQSFREISEELDIPIGTLLSRKSRAVKKIKDKLNHLNL